MKAEIILFAYIPAVISAGLITFSYTMFIRYRKSLENVVLLALIAFLNVIALSYFLSMLKGAAPRWEPYVLVLTSVPFFIWQIVAFKKYWD